MFNRLANSSSVMPGFMASMASASCAVSLAGRRGRGVVDSVITVRVGVETAAAARAGRGATAGLTGAERGVRVRAGPCESPPALSGFAASTRGRSSVASLPTPPAFGVTAAGSAGVLAAGSGWAAGADGATGASAGTGVVAAAGVGAA